MEYEPVIGLEVHVQLKTKSKLFGPAPYSHGHEPNSLTDSVVLALPGSLPVINKEAIDRSVKAGLMLGCKIADECHWDRKNYFYPDLPKGYQISQHTHPICIGGEVEIEPPGPSRNVMGKHRTVQLNRIHLEDDAGKLTHGNEGSLVDYNRAGAPLIEIVTEPDLFSTDEVFAFLNSVRIHMQYAGLSDCDMEKGQMRCDANISMRPKGSEKLGTKVEVKNLNSISGVRNCIEYEMKRQTKMLNEEKVIVQETRRWNAAESYTSSMRSKEDAQDYRYFPDPDLMPVTISEEMRKELGSELPELPFKKQERFFKDYDLPFTITSVLYPSRELSDYFEAAVKAHNNPKLIAIFLVNDLLRELSAGDQEGTLPLSECRIKPTDLAALVKLVDDGDISKQIAQNVLIDMFNTGEAPGDIIDKKGLKQTSNTDELKEICQQAIDENPKPVAQFKEGKDTAINALKGKVMAATKGQANPQVVDTVLRELLK